MHACVCMMSVQCLRQSLYDIIYIRMQPTSLQYIIILCSTQQIMVISVWVNLAHGIPTAEIPIISLNSHRLQLYTNS